ncbi:MAG: DivIVA domain-containing protein [Eubacterium sp.]|nr:DivIVA domain-containing protein [Eubacterium sp.]
MISANDLRNVSLSKAADGYSVDEVNATLNAAADTIDAYVNENKELYRKMELLAAKIEEYRAEEDSIKSALITAQVTADKIKKESSETASELIKNSEDTAKKTVDEANASAEKLVREAREYAAAIVKQKKDEANALTADAEKKANDAINSSKIVAQDILDQAKEISDDLITKSKEEKEAYEKLTASLKENAQSFISNVSALYISQLEELKNAQLDTEKKSEDDVNAIQSEVDSLVNEMDEMENAIPETVTIKTDDAEAAAEEIEEEIEEVVIAEETAEEAFEDVSSDIGITEEEEEDDEPADPMKAVEAFSQKDITPVEEGSISIPEITEEPRMENVEEKSLFDTDGDLPFESYFNVKTEDAHGDRNQTISLVPPDDDEDEGDPKFKGFFGKKKK